MSHSGLQAKQEDAITLLMNEMGQQQGYEQDPSRKDDDDDEGMMHQERLLPELSDYPNNSHCAENKAIWNEYVQPEHDYFYPSSEDNNNEQRSIIALATNPQVEIIRRRCYEKFKKESQENLQRILYEKKASAQTDAWKNLKLPTIPAILEKWHMDAKLEDLELMSKRKKTNASNNDDDDDDLVLVDSNTSKIYQGTIEQLQQARLERTFYDPILVSKDAPALFRKGFQAEVVKASLDKDAVPKNMHNRIKQIQKMLYKVTYEALESYPL
jgi:hypothetical protein